MTRRLYLVSALLGAAALAMAPLFLKGYYVYVLSTVGVYTIVVLGLNVLVGATGQLSIGHAGFFAIGAYASSLLMIRLKLPFLVSAPAAALLTGLVGLLLGFPATRLRGPYLGIATMGFGMLVQQVLQEWESMTGGRAGLTLPTLQIGPLTFNTDLSKYYLNWAVALIVIWLIRNILRSRVGDAWRALRDSEIAAQAIGISVPRYKAIAFAVSAFAAGLAGALYAPLIGFISYESFNLMLSVAFLSAVILGGPGSVIGSVLGAAYLALMPELLRGLDQLQMIAYGLVMIVVMLFLPKGLMEIPALLGRILAAALAQKGRNSTPAGASNQEGR
jgi:branched-chain amino acid transport system permease protein